MKSGKFYKDKFNGKLFGVCAGIADHFEINALWVRLGFIAIALVGAAPLIIPAYVIVAMVAESKPPHLYNDSLVRTFADPAKTPKPARRMETIDE